MSFISLSKEYCSSFNTFYNYTNNKPQETQVVVLAAFWHAFIINPRNLNLINVMREACGAVGCALVFKPHCSQHVVVSLRHFTSKCSCGDCPQY